MKRYMSFLIAFVLCSAVLPAGASHRLTWRDCISPQQLIGAGNYHTVAVRADGTVAAVGKNDTQWYNPAQCDVGGWTDVIAVSAGYNKTMALRRDGTVLYAGIRDYGQGDVEGWTDIVAVSAGSNHCVGLRRDGTVVACGMSGGQTNVAEWTDIVAVSAGNGYTLGLRADGTVVATGYDNNGRMDVGSWSGIRAIAAGGVYSIGLRDDGTAVTAGINYYREPMPVDDWRGVASVCSAAGYCIGLGLDGAVIGADERWTNLIAVDRDPDGSHSVGLRRDGTAFADGDNSYGQCDVSGWQNLMTVPQGPDFADGRYTEKPDSRASLRHVFDKAGLFSADESDRMERLMQGLYSQYGFDSVILTTREMIDRPFNEFVADYYDNLRSPEDYPDGAFFCISTALMEYYEAARGSGVTFLSDRGEDELNAVIQPFLSAGDYSAGVFAYLDYLGRILTVKPPEETIERIARADITPDAPRADLNGVAVDFGAWNISEDSVLEVKTLPPQPFEDQGIVATLYELNLMDSKGVRTNFLTPVTVTLPCPAAADEAAFIQYYDEGLAEWQLVPCTRNKDAGTITFLTDHFSEVAVCQATGTPVLGPHQLGKFETTGTPVTEPLFSYADEYKGPLTPVIVSNGDINAYLAKADDLAALRRFLNLADIPLDDARSRGAWWIMNILGGAGYAVDTDLKLTPFVGVFTEAKWARLNPIFTGIGAFMTMARISYQAAYLGVKASAIFRDNALDVAESILAIASIYTGSLPYTFGALSFFIAGQLDEAYQWATQEPDNWAEYTYHYFNQHDAQFCMDDFQVVWEEEDQDGYVRLDLGGKGCAIAIDQIYRKLAQKPREMNAAYERFITDYCNLFWNADRETIMQYYNDLTSQSLYTSYGYHTVEIGQGREHIKRLYDDYPWETYPGDKELYKKANNIKVYKENFRKRLLNSMQPLLQEMVEHIHNDIAGKLLNELRVKLLPELNRVISFEAIDPDMEIKGMKFDESRFARGDAVIAFGSPTEKPIRLWNDRSDLMPMDYQIKAERNSNTIFRCTMFHWISIGSPKTMVFTSSTATGRETQTVTIKLETPVTTLRLEAPKATPAPVAGSIIGSWQGKESYPLIPGYEGSISIDIRPGDGVYNFTLSLTSEFLECKEAQVYGRIIPDGDNSFVELVDIPEGQVPTGKEGRFGVLSTSSGDVIGINLDIDFAYSAVLTRFK